MRRYIGSDYLCLLYSFGMDLHCQAFAIEYEYAKSADHNQDYTRCLIHESTMETAVTRKMKPLQCLIQSRSQDCAL